jgi:hypothetical protein
VVTTPVNGVSGIAEVKLSVERYATCPSEAVGRSLDVRADVVTAVMNNAIYSTGLRRIFFIRSLLFSFKLRAEPQ